jgi:hypothetical protein
MQLLMASSLSFTAAEACDVNEATESPAKSKVESTTAIFIYFTPLLPGGAMVVLPARLNLDCCHLLRLVQICTVSDLTATMVSREMWPNHKINAKLINAAFNARASYPFYAACCGARLWP